MNIKLAIFLILTSPFILDAQAGSATWNSSPTSSDWNTATNWTPNTVPNGTSDKATFVSSSITGVTIAADITVSEIIFNSGADSFSITRYSPATLTMSGAGVTNNSGKPQNFILPVTGGGEFHFTNSATAGTGTAFTNYGGGIGQPGGKISFYDTAAAGSAMFVNNGTSSASSEATTTFYNSATAGNGTFINNGASAYPGLGGLTVFTDTATAENATLTTFGGPGNGGGVGQAGGAVWFNSNATASNAVITNNGQIPGYFSTGVTEFSGSATAANATITNKGTTTGGSGFGGQTMIEESANAGSATIISEGATLAGTTGGLTWVTGGSGAEGTFIADGGQVSGGGGGSITFGGTSTAANSTLIAYEGVNGGYPGLISFNEAAIGEKCRIELFGGELAFQQHYYTDVPVGSIEGYGDISLTVPSLTVGGNNLKTTFSGVIDGSGALIKRGTGSLALTGANTYTGGTTVGGGKLLAGNSSGSATGKGPVLVRAGTIGGTGVIAGPVTIGVGRGRGARLSPGNVSSLDTLTIQSKLTFKGDATYDFAMNSDRIAADQVIANDVAIAANAVFLITDNGHSVLPVGTTFTAIANTATVPIAGAFSNLADQAVIAVGSNNYQANYEGGDGNDLTLTVVP